MNDPDEAASETENKPAGRRVIIPERLWELIVQVAADMNTRPRWVLNELLMKRLEHMIIEHDVSMFGFEFQRALTKLQTKGRLIDDGLTSEVDVSKLERSSRTQSTFVEVYQNDKGFRAVKSGTYIGTFRTAEAAAWARYLYCKRNRLPYGRLANEIERCRSAQEVRAWTNNDPNKIKHIAIWEAKHVLKDPIEDLSPEDRELENVDPYTGRR